MARSDYINLRYKTNKNGSVTVVGTALSERVYQTFNMAPGSSPAENMQKSQAAAERYVSRLTASKEAVGDS